MADPESSSGWVKALWGGVVAIFTILIPVLVAWVTKRGQVEEKQIEANGARPDIGAIIAQQMTAFNQTLIARITTLETESKDLRKSIEDGVTQRNTMQSSIEELKAENEACGKKNKTLEGKVAEMENEKLTLQREIGILQQDKSLLMTGNEQLGHELELLRRAVNGMRTTPPSGTPKVV